jgi:hypothetical protein
MSFYVIIEGTSQPFGNVSGDDLIGKILNATLVHFPNFEELPMS